MFGGPPSSAWIKAAHVLAVDDGLQTVVCWIACCLIYSADPDADDVVTLAVSCFCTPHRNSNFCLSVKRTSTLPAGHGYGASSSYLAKCADKASITFLDISPQCQQSHALIQGSLYVVLSAVTNSCTTPPINWLH